MGQELFERGGGVLPVFILANNLVSVLHKEVECKIKKLKYKKLEVIQPRIKNKSELPAGGYCILDQWTQSFTVAIDFWPSWLINAVYHLSVNNNKWERMRGLKRGGLLTFFPWKGRAYWEGGLFLTGRHSRWFGGFALPSLTAHNKMAAVKKIIQSNIIKMKLSEEKRY